ncbi:hypothetical protein BGL34_04420 [Fructilactobacillus lindneri]|uniref:HTH-type transcriptional regulator YybA n=2 Tax=Fructilactobacillus lindneri TaxID=53444 RepID=A0A0R2JYH9_9LACO|nr:MarR family winged helix-turn-helix transcriptional regulator [Fructilactobacillus lindneri]ANZ57608.1 hypothetical protein AYR60_01880 [Fructilactobacillus lindneri]ANZ58878.1 hypothetical protein AYR59_01880 [Fructilactobacillus lindneri]KRN79562.1 HTH-type transcriptional regulator YybA [Fructilactobacillus lindneri DSM 20690 = JCM 11027]POG97759.1 hypothetical protein BGL31_06025 [Fructilactobacillus lindneri]POH00015.1 hypothetical protein BGL32_04440 [Fructilactobacillus lindneri]
MAEVDILKLITEIEHGLSSIANKEFKTIGLTKGKFQYVNRIAENPGITQAELTELLKVDKTTASRAMQKLLDEQLIVGKFTENNKRQKQFNLTKKGEQAANFIARENEYSTQQVLSGLSKTERAQLQKLLTKVAKNTDSEWGKVKKGFKRKY